jgi:hypothetical protein
MNEIIRGKQKSKINANEAAELAMNIEKNAEMDFKSGHVILINGWVISETEARQCALLFLS